MAQFGDFFARLFSGGGTRGLSGDGELALPPENEIYNDFLRRHRTEGDLAADPAWLWSTTTGVLRRKGGLGAHLLGQKADAVASFTDILLVLSSADWRRLPREGREESWTARAAALLGERFSDFCLTEDYHLLFPQRPVGFRFMEDGCPEMKGQSFGLQAGEFVTGLVPNLYTGPTDHSRMVIAVHLNLPGQWQGYREIGRLHNDQAQFTLGSHWLDSFRDPALRRPSLYRLHQYADASLVHILHPDLQDRYKVRSQTSEDGVSVLSILTERGEPVAHLILAVIDPSATGMLTGPSSMALPAPRPGIAMPTAGAPLSALTHRTVVPIDIDERIFRLRERGALLQKIHFGKFMEGYDVYLSPEGAVGTSMVERAATLQVRGRVVSLVAHQAGITVDKQPAAVGTPIPLRRNLQIGLNGHTVDYRDLSREPTEGWPYLGEIRREGGNASLIFGGAYKVGRDKTSKVRLPDEPENDNIQWMPGVVDGAMIRSRTGDIPKSRFYTDSIMVASLHAEIDLRAEPVLTSLARHCYTYVRRGNNFLPLHPADKPNGPTRCSLQPGDEILVGNCVFEVSFPPAGEGSSRDDQALVQPPPALDDVPAAAGLGERGPPPPMPHFTVITDPEPEERSNGRGAMLALAGAGPSDFGDVVYKDKVGGPRLVFDEDFHLPMVREHVHSTAVPEGVWTVREADWQIERARPARLVVGGWMVTGDTIIGNHRRVGVALPENRANDEQEFSPADYFLLHTRGKRARIERRAQEDAKLLLGGEFIEETEETEAVELIVVRRDAVGGPDFEFRLKLVPDSSLPDPRAQLLTVNLDEPMVVGMLTLGLPLRTAREIQLGPIRGTALFAGETIAFCDYLDSYRQSDGSFHPFFLRRAGGPWRTVPEDGQPLQLAQGDQLLAGATVYRVEVG